MEAKHIDLGGKIKGDLNLRSTPPTPLDKEKKKNKGRSYNMKPTDQPTLILN